MHLTSRCKIPLSYSTVVLGTATLHTSTTADYCTYPRPAPLSSTGLHCTVDAQYCRKINWLRLDRMLHCQINLPRHELSGLIILRPLFCSSYSELLYMRSSPFGLISPPPLSRSSGVNEITRARLFGTHMIFGRIIILWGHL